jgi:hypothetical protein
MPPADADLSVGLGSAGAFEVALFPWITLEKTANSSILWPKGSRFDSPGQRPGTSQITISSPNGAQPKLMIISIRVTRGHGPLGLFF